MKLWNTLGECKSTMSAHSAVNAIAFTPSAKIVSVGHEGAAKVWDMSDMSVINTLEAGEAAGSMNALTVSPDGSLVATGSQHGGIRLWSIEEGEMLYTIDLSSPIQDLAFCPTRYWVAAATDTGVSIVNLETKVTIGELGAEGGAGCTALAWDPGGNTLYSGHSDNKVRIWSVQEEGTEPEIPE